MEMNDAYLKIELRIFGIRLFSLYCHSNLEEWLNSYRSAKREFMLSHMPKSVAKKVLLKCKAKDCMENENGYCKLDSIEIDIDQACLMYNWDFRGKKSAEKEFWTGYSAKQTGIEAAKVMAKELIEEEKSGKE